MTARFSADGRVLAVGHSDMVVLCDPERGTRYRTKSSWRMSAVAFQPRSDALLVADVNGIVRHRMSFPAPRRLEFTPAELVLPGTGWQAFDFNADGRFFAAFNVRSNMTTVFDHTLTNRLGTVGPHPGTGALALSPDGRWLATDARPDRSARIWDVSAEKLVLAVPAGLQPRSGFSPDGRWLAVTSEDKFELRETGTWKPRFNFQPGLSGRVFGAAAFSPDSRHLAIVTDRFTVNLFDLQRFAPLGTLRPPVAATINGLAFSPDGSHLAAIGAEARVAVWHLRPLQQRLAEFGVGWEEHGAKGSPGENR